VADGFDAATSRRVYQTVPIQPDQVLKEMWENPRRGYDQIVVKAFINLIGIYPVGTCVILDTYEVALVHSANPDVTHVHRPVVRIVTTPRAACSTPDSWPTSRSAMPKAIIPLDCEGHRPHKIRHQRQRLLCLNTPSPHAGGLSGAMQGRDAPRSFRT